MPTDSNETIPLIDASSTMMNSENLSSSSSMKQINKLKRFLSTLYHFGSDISNETGERVRALILALIVSFNRFDFSLSLSQLTYQQFDTGYSCA